MIFSVSSISYIPTDLSLLKEFSKNVSFSNSYNLPSQSAVQKLSMSTASVMLSQCFLIRRYLTRMTAHILTHIQSATPKASYLFLLLAQAELLKYPIGCK